MITIEAFKTLVRETLKVDLDNNIAQKDGVSHDDDSILMIVAGPGSGKTTVLVLRALRHVLVDGILPDQLLITTFTKKAAKELRTRWLDWGVLLTEALSRNPLLRDAVNGIDLNRCRIGTLDSLAEETLAENKLPGEVAPVVVEEAASKLILKRSSFSDVYNLNKERLNQLFARYTFEGEEPRNNGEALAVAKTLCERIIQDRIGQESFRQDSPASQDIIDILARYLDRLNQTNVFDFAFLELRLLERLQNGPLREWVDGIHAILIDEYQDTNPLQEAVYFEIISRLNIAVTIVGDDDQSMYRFRGGSVELFTQFAARCNAATGRQTRRVDMIANYRSSEEIVRFYNSYIVGDAGFSSARISPPKLEVVPQRGATGIPVLGMFRADPASLAESLASWIDDLLINRRKQLSNGDASVALRLPDKGDMGDFVLLAHSVEEIQYDGFKGDSKQRFASYFRQEMANRGRYLFNPRGRSLRTIQSVQQLLGLLLLCVDPDGSLTDLAYPTNESRFFLTQWRNSAEALIVLNPQPSDDGGLRGFITAWQQVSRGIANTKFPPDWPILELVFKLVTWMPGFKGDPEHQVWLEAITRTVSSIGMASPYGMQVLQSDEHRALSRVSFIRDALLPIAENEVTVDEGIMPSVPRNRLQLMTIHQSKGLEFPLVIVDIGSHFTGNWQKQRFLRFPEKPSSVVVMEDDVERHLEAPIRGLRSPMDRTFDDLVRLYYVAYSRPQSVLMLIGCEKCLAYGQGRDFKGSIPNIALGWRRDGEWPWRQPFTGRRPPIHVEIPMFKV